MKILILFTLFISTISLWGNYFIPKIQKPIVDSSTGFNVQPGFQVELVYHNKKNRFMDCMVFDKKGNLTVSDQKKANLPHRNSKQVKNSMNPRLKNWMLLLPLCMLYYLPSLHDGKSPTHTGQGSTCTLGLLSFSQKWQSAHGPHHHRFSRWKSI